MRWGLRLADVVIITKCESAGIDAIERCESGIYSINPKATVLTADSPVLVEGGEHQLRVSAIISPLPQAVGALVELYRLHPEAQSVLPTPGFGPSDLADLKATIEATPARASSTRPTSTWPHCSASTVPWRAQRSLSAPTTPTSWPGSCGLRWASPTEAGGHPQGLATVGFHA